MALAYIDGVYTYFPGGYPVEFLEDLSHNASMYIENGILYSIKDDPGKRNKLLDLSTIADAQGQPKLYDLVWVKAIAFSNQVLCFNRYDMRKYMVENAEPIGYQSGFLYYKKGGCWYRTSKNEDNAVTIPVPPNTEYFWPGTSLHTGNLCYTADNKAFHYSLLNYMGQTEVSHITISGHKLVKIGVIVTQIICPDGRSVNTELQDKEIINVESNEQSLIITYEDGMRRLHNRCCSYRNPVDGTYSNGHAIDDNVRLNKFTNTKSARN